MTNSGRPSRCWVRWLVWLSLSITGLAFAVLLVVNLVDYRRYYWATHFEQTEGLEKVRELARTCFDLGKNGHVTLNEYPASITRLNPRWVSLDRNYAQIGLYGHDDASVFLVFEKHDGNEVVSVCDYVVGRPETRTVFVQDQLAYDTLHPKKRIVTLAQATMHEYTEWIVLADEVRVINWPGSGGASMLGRRSISEAERRSIEAELKAMPRRLRGQHFQSGVIDGIHLHILFGADGKHGPEDIELDNTWREEAGPLVDLVEQLSPMNEELRFRAIIEHELKEHPRGQTAAKWDEQERLERPRMPLWLFWRCL